MDASAPRASGEPQPNRLSSTWAECEDRARLRREGQEELSQRLFSIILAVHAAEKIVGKNPAAMSAILDLIHVQSAASLEDLRRLDALDQAPVSL